MLRLLNGEGVGIGAGLLFKHRFKGAQRRFEFVQFRLEIFVGRGPGINGGRGGGGAHFRVNHQGIDRLQAIGLEGGGIAGRE